MNILKGAFGVVWNRNAQVLLVLRPNIWDPKTLELYQVRKILTDG